MAQQLKALALLKALGSVPNTHVVAHITHNPSARVYDVLF